MATYSSILGWRIPWTEEPGRLSRKRDRHNLVTKQQSIYREKQRYVYATMLGCCSSVAQLCPTLCNLVNCSSQASLSFTISRSLIKLMSVESVMPSIHLIICHPFSSHLQSFPASGSFPMSQFSSGGQSTGASTSASVLPMNIQG